MESEGEWDCSGMLKKCMATLFSKLTGKFNAKTIIQAYLSDFLIQTLSPTFVDFPSLPIESPATHVEII
ncbi:MAG TPA: hypothetical protein VFJ51_10050 [Nitrososphaeraceae archaeon]|nr:hypothetical protein [Nitrososphaeraceae archaeon]